MGTNWGPEELNSSPSWKLYLTSGCISEGVECYTAVVHSKDNDRHD